ncbi:hypothetical protein CEUSTIGMA_g9136.t1 [Chlamydomonas eustigma]|uniref:Protein kinase domain-containing protein n=1 Tax=Chlamydomonas eustigma TaxID=1157962 RepID=A0A250XF43_9CHLO|nr:hypothetical protein CEUSTIGMA_g9136.t1 [Chlamydomonas eustigma]|eukprot:GAX81708.1 hypothetical protein CEUSTIGMA_g9136.t1 [Chlamydomonas eustigma]
MGLQRPATGLSSSVEGLRSWVPAGNRLSTHRSKTTRAINSRTDSYDFPLNQQNKAPEIPLLSHDSILHSPQLAVSEALSSIQSLNPMFTSAVKSAQDTTAHTANMLTQMSLHTAAVFSSSIDKPMEVHFGAHALQHSASAISDWVMSSVEWLEASTPGSLNLLSESFHGFKRSTALIASIPAPTINASDISSMAAATSAVAKSLLQQQLGAAASAADAAALSTTALLSQLLDALDSLQSTGLGGYSIALVALLTTVVMSMVVSTAPNKEYQGYTERLHPDDLPVLGSQYSADSSREYWSRRPLAVAQRSAEILSEAVGLGSMLLLDVWTGRLQANEADRAVQLRGVIERLGPAFVKVAQALSTRSDILSPEYFLQIQKLQDRVPPFPCAQAKAAMKAAFKRPVEEVFSVLSDKPVAAASLGQVYRATLKPEMGGGDVAVKVLRPGVLEQVSLDLYIMREASIMLESTGRKTSNFVAVIDEWAGRFLAEMDYKLEAQNAYLLGCDMSSLSGIKVATVVSELSTSDVLTTEWVAGEKLSDSRASDVRELCTTLLNAYLIQLLETGLLHADPHPGNLIRTPEGKICILDYGLMTLVTEDQRWAILEYIAHLSTENWGALAVDLQRLGFIPLSVDVKQGDLIPRLGSVMSQLVGGGGAAKVNIDKVTDDLSELGKRYPITIPPFFALILRAFSVIEGIALGVDPDYAIVKECFPYLSRRLLQDDSERSRNILRQLLYGSKQHLDIDRLTRVADSFGSYTTDGLQQVSASSATLALSATSSSTMSATAPVTSTSPQGSASAGLDPVLKDALVIMFGKRGTYVQDLLVEEAVAAVDALSKSTVYSILQSVLSSAPAAFASSSITSLGPFRSILSPLLPTPVELLSRVSLVLASTPEDVEALAVVSGISSLLQRGGAAAAAAAQAGHLSAGVNRGQPGIPATLSRAAAELAPLLPEISPGLNYMAETFARAFMRRLVQRFANLGGLSGLGVRDASSATAILRFLDPPIVQRPSFQEGKVKVGNRGVDK